MLVRGKWSSLDRFIKDTKKDRASRSFMIRRDQFGRRMFIRMCYNFGMCHILSPVYSWSPTTASWDTCTFVLARLLLFLLIYCVSIYFICLFYWWNEKCKEFVNIEKPALNRKSHRFSLEVYECYYYYRTCQNFGFRWLTFYTYM